MVTLLALIAACLVAEVFHADAPARAQQAAPEGPQARRNVFAVAGQIGRDSSGVYVIDADNGTIAAYEWISDRIAGRKLRLVAARNFAFDMQLDDYNTEPLPRDIKSLVEQHRRLNNAATQPG